MKILYAIQGTGNGHLSRARDVIPALLKHNIDLDILISGHQADVDLPYKVKYNLQGLFFVFGKQGGIDFKATFKNTKIFNFFKEIKQLPIQDYDLIINDFEPVSAWGAKFKKVPCVSFSHQAAVLSKKAPKPKVSINDIMGRLILNNYAPTQKQYGLHFKSYDPGIFTPIIRNEIRKAIPKVKNHYTVYLPAYNDDTLLSVLSKIDNAQWQVFSKHNKKEITIGNVHIQPINNEKFIESLLNCTGLFCGGGFEAPAEALFLKKKLMVIPMKGQYEQQCNAAALKDLGIPVIPTLHLKYLKQIQEWVNNQDQIEVDFPDNTDLIVNQILKEFNTKQEHYI